MLGIIQVQSNVHIHIIIIMENSSAASSRQVLLPENPADQCLAQATQGYVMDSSEGRRSVFRGSRILDKTGDGL